MTIGFLTNIISPHQLPLARELVKQVGYENYLYVYTEEFHAERANMGWSNAADGVKTARYGEESRQWLLDADLVYIEERNLDLIEARLKAGKPTFYVSERWFKPMSIGVGERCRCSLPGSLRLLVPWYRKMVKRFVSLSKYDSFRCLPQGPWAKKDFLQMGVSADKIVPWGYFVQPGVEKRCRCRKNGEPLKVLWAGRDIPLKHVKDIERAVAIANKLLATAVNLNRQPQPPISFTKITGVPIAEVRKAMQNHDTFVFASNAQEGWGAVVSEALEEGMNALGTLECGAPPTLLPRERLFKCGKVKKLAELLIKEYKGELPPCSIGEWTAHCAAEKMLNMAGNRYVQ